MTLTRAAPLLAVAVVATVMTALATAPVPAQVDDNPCLTERVRYLRCPDLVMKPPHGPIAERANE